MKNLVLILMGLILSIWILISYFNEKKQEQMIFITNFNECALAGNPIMESYPRQCIYNDQTFTEEINENMNKSDLIKLQTPQPNQSVTSPLKIAGEARGGWFFEGSFPVLLVNWDGLIIAQGFATAQGEWMTEDFVSFTAELEFDKPFLYNNGALILKKDNPSGLPEHDDALEIPIFFE